MGIEVLSVSQITRNIRNIIEGNFCDVWVEGEVSGVKYHSSGHVYFSLVDEFSSIRAVVYRSRRGALSFEIKNGMEIVVFGSVGVYEKGGYYQIIVEHVKKAGLGKKFEELERIKTEFKKKGYFDRKRKIPLYPNRILIVTSTTGAAIRDMLNILRRRMFGIEVLIYPVTVQGESAVESIISALRHINTLELGVDCLVLARGGGSMEDLWVFNNPEIAMALFNSKYPTVSAIGHETDNTLCDFVADRRAETPSSAMEMLLKNRMDLLDRVVSLKRSIESYTFMILKHRKEKLMRVGHVVSGRFLMRRIEAKYTEIDGIVEKINSRVASKVDGYRRKLERCFRDIVAMSPEARLKINLQRVGFLRDKIFSDAIGKVKDFRNSVSVLESKVKSSDPFAVLKKGYSITMDRDGNTIRSISSVSSGDTILTRLYDGVITSTVNNRD